MQKLVLENDELKRDWTTKESTLKSLNDQVRAEKSAVEKQLYPVEFSSPVRDRLRKTTMVESRVVPRDQSRNDRVNY